MAQDDSLSEIVAIAGDEAAPAAAPRFIPSMEDIEFSAAAGGLDQLFSLTSASRSVVADPRQAPWNAITLLGFFRGAPGNQQQVAHATGFLIKPDVVLTAAHNFDLLFDSIGVYPGYHATLNPVASLIVRARARHTQRDAAVLIVTPSQQAVMQINDDGPVTVTLAGYSLRDANGNPQLTSGSAPYQRVGTAGRYAIQVRRGDSGSPVFVNSAAGPRAVAIHSAARDLGNGLIGIGQSIGPDLTALIGQLETAARQQIAGG